MSNNNMLKIIEPNKKISIDEVNNFEKEFKINLPNDYKEFLLEYNGGLSENNMIFEFNNVFLNPFSIYTFYDLSTIRMCIKTKINNPSDNTLLSLDKKNNLYM